MRDTAATARTPGFRQGGAGRNVSGEGHLNGKNPPQRSEYEYSLIKLSSMPPKLDEPKLAIDLVVEDILSDIK